MPYKSAKQKRLMQAVAHSPSFAKKVGIPQSVGQKFEDHKAEGGKVSALKSLIAKTKAAKQEKAAAAWWLDKGGGSKPAAPTPVSAAGPAWQPEEHMYDSPPGWEGVEGDEQVFHEPFTNPAQRRKPTNEEKAEGIMRSLRRQREGLRSFDMLDLNELEKRMGPLLDAHSKLLPSLDAYDMHLNTRDLPPEDFMALDRYMGSGFSPLNEQLRHGNHDWADPRDLDQLTERLDSILARYNLLSPMTLYRGVGRRHNNLLHDDPGFQSWTVNPLVADSFSGGDGTVMFMDAPSGIRGLPLRGGNTPSEMEVLLPRNHVVEQIGDPIMDDRTYLPVRLKNEYAGGGKVSGLKHFSEWLKEAAREGHLDFGEDPAAIAKAAPFRIGMYGNNTNPYLKLLRKYGWDPKITPEELAAFESYSLGDLGRMNNPQAVHELANQHPLIANEPLTLYRGMTGVSKPENRFKKGQIIEPPWPQSTSLSHDTTLDFMDPGSFDSAHFTVTNEPGAPLLPMPISGQDELVIPAHSKLVIDDLFDHPEGVLGVKARRVPYAEGGQVSDDESWLSTLADLARKAGLPTLERKETAGNRARFLSALISNWYGLGADGDPKFLGIEDQGPPRAEREGWFDTPEQMQSGDVGLVDQVKALPGLVHDTDSSSAAQNRLNALAAKINQQMGVGKAQGLEEHLVEAGGMMAGQLPVPAAEFAKVREMARMLPKAPAMIARPAAALAEWFGPTVNPSARNYLEGAAAGGALDQLDESTTPQQNLSDLIVEEHSEGGMVGLQAMARKYADGGQIRATANTLSAIKNAMVKASEGDHASALDVLRGSPDAMGDKGIAALLAEFADSMGEVKPPVLKKAEGGKVKGFTGLLKHLAEMLDTPQNAQAMATVANPNPVSPAVKQMAEDIRGGQVRTPVVQPPVKPPMALPDQLKALRQSMSLRQLPPDQLNAVRQLMDPELTLLSNKYQSMYDAKAPGLGNIQQRIAQALAARGYAGGGQVGIGGSGVGGSFAQALPGGTTPDQYLQQNSGGVGPYTALAQNAGRVGTPGDASWWYTYGMGPEYNFYANNGLPTGGSAPGGTPGSGGGGGAQMPTDPISQPLPPGTNYGPAVGGYGWGTQLPGNTDGTGIIAPSPGTSQSPVMTDIGGFTVSPGRFGMQNILGPNGSSYSASEFIAKYGRGAYDTLVSQGYQKGGG
jgi:hypothetical protein